MKHHTLELPPTQDSSHHQDDISFFVGNLYKPSFVTGILGWGVDRNHTIFPSYYFQTTGRSRHSEIQHAAIMLKLGSDFNPYTNCINSYNLSIWVFPKIGIPQNGWFFKNWWFGGTPIFGNTHFQTVKRLSPYWLDLIKHTIFSLTSDKFRAQMGKIIYSKLY